MAPYVAAPHSPWLEWGRRDPRVSPAPWTAEDSSSSKLPVLLFPACLWVSLAVWEQVVACPCHCPWPSKAPHAVAYHRSWLKPPARGSGCSFLHPEATPRNPLLERGMGEGRFLVAVEGVGCLHAAETTKSSQPAVAQSACSRGQRGKGTIFSAALVASPTLPFSYSWIHPCRCVIA